MKKNPKFKAGAIIILAEGEYSDYRTGPLLRCLKDLDMKELAEAFHASCPEKFERYCSEADASVFALWLTTNGWMEEMEYAEIHTGSYGNFKCCGFTPPECNE